MVFTGAVFGQNISGNQLNAELKKASQYLSKRDFSNAKICLNQVQREALKLKNYSALYQAEYQLGEVFLLQDKESKALLHYLKALAATKELKDAEPQLRVAFRMGDIFYSHQLYAESLNYFELADSLLFWAHKPKYLILLNQRLAISYFRTMQYEKARDYYSELLKFSIQYKDLKHEIEGRKGVASSLVNINEVDNAIQYQLTLIPIYKMQQNRKEMIDVYFQIANEYFVDGQSKKSIEYANLILNNKSTNGEMKMKMLIFISSQRMAMGVQYRQTILRDLSNALKIAHKLKDKNSILEIQYLQAQYYYNLQEFKMLKPLILNLVHLLEKDIECDLQLKILHLAIDFAKQKKQFKKATEYYDLLVIQQKRKYNAMLTVNRKNKKSSVYQELKRRSLIKDISYYQLYRTEGNI